MRRRRGLLAGCLGLVAAAALSMASPRAQGTSTTALVAGLDHVVVAVDNLEAAAARYGELGFALKPGRPHDNGIRNQHVKFTDGTEVELLTAPAAHDALTTHYRAHLADGDGPAFMALYAPDMNALADGLRRGKSSAERDGPSIGFPSGDPLRYVFFFGRNHSPTDRPEHFAHANSAKSLIAVWLAGSGDSEESLFATIGASAAGATTFGSDKTRFSVETVGDGKLYLFSAAHQTVKGRKVIGVTLSIASRTTAQRVLDRRGIKWSQGGPSGPDAMVLPPSETCGLWLELSEAR